ncbi:DEAD/DEAH box helicase [candidate division WOR-3 bacterium]|nr:DEAD/DEAH box helicase [candidate division WOR-3 bacterium]
MIIIISNLIQIEEFNGNQSLASFVKKSLTLPNFEYFLRKKMGKSVWGLKSSFTFYKIKKDKIVVPRGFLDRLLLFFEEHSIEYKIEDKRSRHQKVIFSPGIELFESQKTALRDVLKKDGGILVAPPGSGKTVVALKIIEQKSLPSLVLVHRRQLMDQWADRIESFLKIPKREIGSLSTKKIKKGEKITLATLQTLSKMHSVDITDLFGTVIVDECHHIPAKMFRKAIVKLNPRYIYGLTATPVRKNRDEKAIFIFIGDKLHDLTQKTITNTGGDICIKIVGTGFFVPFNIKTGEIEILNKMLIFDTHRNRIITEMVMGEISKNRKTVLLTERKEHIEALKYFFSGNSDFVTMTGDDSKKERAYKRDKINTGDYQLIMATGQYFGEGTDFISLDCLFLAFPVSFEGKLLQYVGRILRGDSKKVIYDFRDDRVEYFEKQYKKRELFYKTSLSNVNRPVSIEFLRA